MLTKVMKYELRAGARMLLPLFGISILACAFSRVLLFVVAYIFAPAAAAVNAFATAVALLLFVALVLLSVAYMVWRFYQSTAGEEAYLSFTLPVKMGSHLNARIIVGCFYTLLSTVVGCACALILVPAAWPGLVQILAFIVGGQGGIPLKYSLAFLGLVLAFVLLATLTNLVRLYASIVLGGRLSQNRVIGAGAAYLIINAIEGVAALLLIVLPIGILLRWNLWRINAYIESLSLQLHQGMQGAALAAALSTALGYAWVFMGILSVILFIFTAVLWQLSRRSLEHKLNL